MKFVRDFKQFITEKKKDNFEDKIKGHGYFKDLSTSTSRKKANQMKDQASRLTMILLHIKNCLVIQKVKNL